MSKTPSPVPEPHANDSSVAVTMSEVRPSRANGNGPLDPEHPGCPPPPKGMSAWGPRGSFVSVCEKATCPQVVRCAGTTQNCGFMATLWSDYAKKNEQNPDMADAFAEAFSCCTRRQSDIIAKLACSMIKHFDTFRPETFRRLAFVVSELACRDAAVALFKKGCGIALDMSYYMSLVRLATETLPCVDLAFAIEVMDEMADRGQPFCAPMLRQLMLGLLRTPKPDVRLAIRCMKFRQTQFLCTIEKCLLSVFSAVMETATGKDIQIAAQHVQSLSPEIVHLPISDVCDTAPSFEDQKAVFTAPCVRYFLVDVFACDIGALSSIPPRMYVVFLYSSLRALNDYLPALSPKHPLHTRAKMVRQLLALSKQAVVVPLDGELMMRMQHPTPHPSIETTQDKFMAFARASANSCSAGRVECTILTSDPKLTEQARSGSIPVVKQLPDA